MVIVREGEAFSNEKLGRTTKLPSLAVHGQAFTIKELLKKYATGQLPDIQKQGQFDDSEDVESMNLNPVARREFDLIDATDLMEDLSIRQQEYIKRTEILKTEKSKARAKADFDKAVSEAVQLALANAKSKD